MTVPVISGAVFIYVLSNKKNRVVLLITFKANSRQAKIRSDDLVTSHSIGIPVTFVLSEDFDGLESIAVFKGSGHSVDVIPINNTCVVPPECLTVDGGYLEIGVYGRNADGTIAIPTIWADAQRILRGAVPSGVDPSQPTPDWTAQVQSIASSALSAAENAVTTANSVEARADRGEFDGADGSDGVSPTVDVFEITGGHRVVVTDASGETSFDVFDGEKGDDGVSPVISVGNISGGHRVTIVDASSTQAFDVMDGATGATGPSGQDGYSPTVTATSISGGTRVTITDRSGAHTFDVMNGATGPSGQDGVSPTVSVTEITDGHQVTITDAGGSHSFSVMDGETGATGADGPPGPAGADGKDGKDGQDGQDGAPGQDGQDGADGVSPEVTITSITGGHSVTITDADHPSGQTFNVMDGQDGAPGQNGSDGAPGQNGQDGQDGVSPEVTIASITGGHSVTITDVDHPNGQSFNVMDGQDGAQGPAGPVGVFVGSTIPSGYTLYIDPEGSIPYAAGVSF